jgi:mRNA interferase MazF
MVDKPVTIRRERIGQLVGHLEGTDMSRVNIAIAFIMGLAD